MNNLIDTYEKLLPRSKCKVNNKKLESSIELPVSYNRSEGTSK